MTDYSDEQKSMANAAIDDLGLEIEFAAYPVTDVRAELHELHECAETCPAFVFHGEGPRFRYTIIAVPMVEAVIGSVQ